MVALSTNFPCIMDISHARPQLPAIGFLDVKSEDNLKNRTMPPASQAPVSIGTPNSSYAFGAGPPHAHSGAPTTAWAPAKGNAHTPPESRRPSGEEPDASKPTVRQSLPSLSEIIGGDGPAFAKGPPSSLPAGLAPSAHLSHLQPNHHSPPSPTAHRPLLGANSSSYPTFPASRSDAPPRSLFPSVDHTKPGYGRSEDSRGSIHSNLSGHPASQSGLNGTRERSPAFESSAPPHLGKPSAGPPTGPHQASFAPRADIHPPVTSAPAPYQPASVFGAPPTNPAGWAPEGQHYPGQLRHDYKDTVKRHLDTQHLEYALSEIGHISRILNDFATRYGNQLYAAQRSGTSLSNVPSAVEADEMVTKARVQLEQLISIREFILDQQTAFEHQASDMQQRGPGLDKPSLSGEHSPQDYDDKHGGFSADSKKPRRGRAAPPGRCHSCNRAETPEWRRGPDGARTLCNACGLHYAKLTRKNNNATKAAAMTNSSLRTKETMP